jgi:hypothetical protein
MFMPKDRTDKLRRKRDRRRRRLARKNQPQDESARLARIAAAVRSARVPLFLIHLCPKLWPALCKDLGHRGGQWMHFVFPDADGCCGVSLFLVTTVDPCNPRCGENHRVDPTWLAARIERMVDRVGVADTRTSQRFFERLLEDHQGGEAA